MHDKQQETQEKNPNFSSYFLPDLSMDGIIQLQKNTADKVGAWFDTAIHARRAARMKRLYDEMDVNLGFRVVREIV